ncbi:hypothetical protein ALC57_03587 [Trachymyrmex cornetzi]|uniref:Uncharacterized protein n=1 Tax=Trachymyrmex cornetzi TaxID=471704 RepID=A0A195EG72_9HYME|nr:hypothetical protein ALC57_03587 [Trachymyrmex cornetzi]
MIHAVGEPVECIGVFTLISRAVRRAGMREKRKRGREKRAPSKRGYTYPPRTKRDATVPHYRVLKMSHDRRAKLSPRPTRMNCDDHA